MRILMLSQFYPPIQGGEEQSVSNLSRELAARGHHVAVATIGPPDSPPFEQVDGVRVHRIKGTIQRMPWLFAEAARRHAPPIPDPELTLALARLLRSERPDIVHAHNWLGYQYLPLKALGGPPLVVTTHDMSIVCATKAFMYDGAPCSGPGVGKCLECTAEHYGRVKGTITAAANSIMGSIHKRQADMFLPVSWSAAAGNQLVGSDLPFQVIPNFLSDDAGRAETGYEQYLEQLPDSPFLLFVGGLRRIKGIEILLRAYSGLRDAPPLVLIGYDCLDTPSSWPESVVVLKNWPHAAVMQAWRRCMVGLVPSICQETFGLVALEAMACGKPVVASRIGGLQEVVADGETGFLVEPGNIAALQTSIERVLGSAELRERLGAAARTRADQFRASAVVPQFERAYRDVLAKQHGQAEKAAIARLA